MLKRLAMVPEWLLVCAFIAMGLLFRAAVVVVLDFKPESDYLAYQAMAMNLLAGHGVVDNMGNLAMYNSGYPLLVLAPVFGLFDGSLLAAQIANAVLGGISIGLVYGVAREAGAGKAGRLLAAALWAVYLPSAVYAEYLAKENLMIPIMLGIVWTSLRLYRDPTVQAAALCGLLFGAVTLVGNAAISLGLALAIAMWCSRVSFGRKFVLSIVLAFCAACVVTPWLLRNQHMVGAAVLNTNGGFNFYLGNNPAADGFFVSIADTPRGDTWHELLAEKGEVEASRTLGREAVAWIKENPGRFIELAGKKAVMFWAPPLHDGRDPESLAEVLVRKVWLGEFLLIGLVAAAGLLAKSMWRRETWIIWGAVVGYTAIHMLFMVLTRYREPIMPMLCVLAALSAENLFKPRQTKSHSA